MHYEKCGKKNSNRKNLNIEITNYYSDADNPKFK